MGGIVKKLLLVSALMFGLVSAANASVIVADKNNSSYTTGGLSVTNGFYRAESYNFGLADTNSSDYVTLNGQNLPITFANAGVCQGAVIFPWNNGASITNSITVNLQQNIATVWTTIATQTISASTILGGNTSIAPYAVPFKWVTPVAVTNAASTYRLNFVSSGGSGTWYLLTTTSSSAPSIQYVAWCDTKVTASSNADCVIAVDKVVVDQSFTLKGVAPTVASPNVNASVCGIACSVATPTIDQVALFTWQDTPSSSYTLTLDGLFILPSHAGFRVGTPLVFTQTVAVGDTSATLTSNFLGTTGTYQITFQNGQYRTGTLTNGSTAVTWTGAMTEVTGSIGVLAPRSNIAFAAVNLAQQFTITGKASPSIGVFVSGFYSSTTNYGSSGGSLILCGQAVNYKSDISTAWLGASANGTTTFANSAGKLYVDTMTGTVGACVTFSNSGGALPTGISANTPYYVLNAGLLSTTPGGTAISWTNNGSGTTTCYNTVITQNLTGWSAGNKIYVGRSYQNTWQSNTGVYTINTIVTYGSQNLITLTSQLSSGFNPTIPGGTVIKYSGYGGVFESDTAGTSSIAQRVFNPNHFFISGVQWYNIAGANDFNNGNGALNETNGTYYSQMVVSDCSNFTPAQNYLSMTSCGGGQNPYGAYYNNINSVEFGMAYTVPIYGRTNGLGVVSMTNCYFANCYGYIGQGAVSSNTFDIENVIIDGGLDGFQLNGSGSYYINCTAYGCRNNSNNAGFRVGQFLNSTLTNCTADSCGYGLAFSDGTLCSGIQTTGFSFGSIAANSTDIYMGLAPYIDFILSNTVQSIASLNMSTTLQKSLVVGSLLKFDYPANAANTFSWYSNAGIFSRDNSNFSNSTSSIKFAATKKNAGRLSTTFIAKAGSTSLLKFNMQYDTNYASGGASTYAFPSVTVSGAGVTSVTATATSAALNAWEENSIAITNSTSFDELYTATFSAQSNSGNGTAWLDGLVLFPMVTSCRFYGYTDDPSNVVRTTDPVIVLSKSAAAALSSQMSMNFATNTLTVTGTVSLSNIYDFLHEEAALVANLGYSTPITSADGHNFIGTFNLSLGAASSITGTGTLNIGSRTLTITAGAATTANIQSNSNALVPLVITGIIPGSRVQIYNVTSSIERFNAIVAGTSITFSATHTSDQTMRIRIKYTDSSSSYLMYTATGTLTSTGLSVVANQQIDSVYATNGIDGSSVTECSISGGTVRLYVNDPTNNTMTFQRVYNWYQYVLGTSVGIAQQSSTYFYAISPVEYRFDPSMKIVNQDTVHPLTITGANVAPTSGVASIIDNSNGASTVLYSYFPVDASGKLSNLDAKVSDAITAADDAAVIKGVN